MLPGAGMVQMTGETLTTPEIKHISQLLENHGIRCLALRECKVTDKECKMLMAAVGRCRSIGQLILSLGLVGDPFRIKTVEHAILRNRSLSVLCLHGNKLGDEGVGLVCQALTQHPHIISLDLGDCAFGDKGLEAVCDLLPPSGGKSGLQDLTLSANTDITSRGWAKFSIAVAASSMLKKLYLDYNKLGDYGAGCLAVSLAANRMIELLDLEGTDITEHSAKLFLHLVMNYPLKLKRLVLSENRVNKSTVEAIRSGLQDFHGSTSDVVDAERQDSVMSQPGHISDVTSPKETFNNEMEELEGSRQPMNTPDKEQKYDEVEGRPLTETEEWGEELPEVSLGQLTSPRSSEGWVSFKKH